MTSLVLLYDGTCGFCDRTVKLVLRHDRQRTLRFAALESPYGVAVRARHPEIAAVDSLLWVEQDVSGEAVWTRSDAALRLAGYLGGPWRLLRLGRMLPRRLRDKMYDAFARRRYRWFGRVESCELPSAEERSRFITTSTNQNGLTPKLDVRP